MTDDITEMKQYMVEETEKEALTRVSFLTSQALEMKRLISED